MHRIDGVLGELNQLIMVCLSSGESLSMCEQFFSKSEADQFVAFD